MKALVVVGSLLFAGCSARSLQDARPPGGLQPATTFGAAWLVYADDGTLIAASRETVVRLDARLNEIDRTLPPFPFDGKVNPPGRMYFAAQRDGRVVAMSWQSDNVERPSVGAGAIVFGVPSAALIRLDSYAEEQFFGFQGLSLSPDGQTTAASIHPEIQVTTVADGRLLWRANKPFVSLPPFSLGRDALVVASDDAALELVGAGDGAPLLTIAAPQWHWYDPVVVSRDGSTLAAATAYGVVETWRLSDGASLATARFPSDVAGIPLAITLSPQGDMVAASMVPGGSGALLVWAGDRLLYRRDGEATIDALAFSPDGATLATVSAEHGLQLLRASDGAVVAERILPR